MGFLRTYALILLSGSCLAGTIRVPPGGIPPPFESTRHGDTLLFLPGTHAGNLMIDRKITLLGEGNAVVRGEGKGSVIVVLADSCSVIGLTIEHSGGMLAEEDAGILLKSAGNIVRNNTLRDVLFGIYLYHSEGNLIEGNRIAGRRELDLGERGSGIHIWNSNSNTFVRNLITDARDGFYIQNANRTLVTDNVVRDLRYGLHYMYADTNIFLRNVFEDNVAGAAVMYSKDITIRHNLFQRNRGFASFGILFQDCQGLQVDSNVISDNVVGLFFEATTDNAFRRNIIAKNDVALEMFQNSTGNRFEENNFLDNVTPLLLIGKSTGSKWSVAGRGNYWSDYAGYDMDGDGIGDVPMRIENAFEYLEGRNANVRLFLYSPASQALALAARAFPVLGISQEVDAAPLMRPVPTAGMPAVELLATEEERSALRSPAETAGWALIPLLAGGVLLRAHRIVTRKKV